MLASEIRWEPYVVQGTRHPGVWISGLAESRGRELTAKLETGGYTNPHTHSGTETITVLGGLGDITIDGVSTSLKAGDRITVAAGSLHSLKNAADEDLLVHAAFEPSFFEQETYLL